MAPVSLTKKRKATEYVGLTDKTKLKIIMKYLHLTPSELCLEFKLSAITFNKIFKHNSTGYIKEPFIDRVVSMYPDIRKGWLINGEGFMNNGLYPNIKLSKSIECSFRMKVDKFMSSKYIYGFSKVIGIPVLKLCDILDNRIQMDETDLNKVSKLLEAKISDLIDVKELKDYSVLNKVKSKVIIESMNKSSIPHSSDDLEFKDIPKVPKLDNPSEFYEYLCRSLNKNFTVSDVVFLTGMPRTTVFSQLHKNGRLGMYSVERYSRAFRLPIKELMKFLDEESREY